MYKNNDMHNVGNVQFYIANSKNKHTMKATKAWLRTYERWAKTNNEPLEIHKLTNAIELNAILERFFANIKKLMARNMSHVRSLHSKSVIDT